MGTSFGRSEVTVEAGAVVAMVETGFLMHVTIETELDEPTTERFLALYRAGFEPLDTVAAGRQSLTDDEFRAEMASASVLKFMGWDSSDAPVALLTATTDLEHVAWISPGYYAQRFPEQAGRDAIVYVGSVVVDNAARGGPWMRRLGTEIARYCAERHAVMAFDCCQHNVEANLPRMFTAIARSVADVQLEEIDSQHYYAFAFKGLREGADERWTQSRISSSDLPDTPHRSELSP